jgi:hypothetical protein
MATVFEKLNLKDQRNILVLNAPKSFESDLAGLRGVIIHRSLSEAGDVQFSLAFVTRKSEVDALAKPLGAQAKGDAIVWFAYPKGTSKKYKCDFNRDNGWDAFDAVGFEVVRAVAIDEDWSALRLRRKEYIKAR